MENYEKASSETVGDEEREQWNINVKSGTKLRNLISHSLRLLKTDKLEKIVLTGSGPTVTKTITCAEIVKRKKKGLHQHNELFYTSVEDKWKPKQERLDLLKVTRKVPSIRITLSTVPLDPNEVGYQAPGKFNSPVEFNSSDFELSEDNPLTSKGRGQKNYGNRKRHRGGPRQSGLQATGEDRIRKDSTEQDQDRESHKRSQEKERHPRYHGKRGGYHGGPKSKSAKRTVQDAKT